MKIFKKIKSLIFKRDSTGKSDSSSYEFKKRQFDEDYDWFLEHKDELNLSEEAKKFFTEENKKHISVNSTLFRHIREQYEGKHTKESKGRRVY